MMMMPNVRHRMCLAAAGEQRRYKSSNRNRDSVRKKSRVRIERRKGVVQQPVTVRDSDDETSNNLAPKKEKLSIMALARRYGAPFVLWEASLWLGGLGAMYVSLETANVDVIEWCRTAGVAEYLPLDSIKPEHGTFAVAFALNEVLEIVRLPFAAATTPMVVRYWERSKQAKTDRAENTAVDEANKRVKERE
jgi:FAM210A/B-like domain